MAYFGVYPSDSLLYLRNLAEFTLSFDYHPLFKHQTRVTVNGLNYAPPNSYGEDLNPNDCI